MDRPIKVLLVTSDREHCGVREYGRALQAAVHRADPGIQVVEYPDTDPAALETRGTATNWRAYDIIHLNHHAALHSRWNREHVERIQNKGVPVVVTQHDTFETGELMRERGFTDFRGANLLIFHEPVAGMGLSSSLKSQARAVGAHEAGGMPKLWYLRQPVPSHFETSRRPGGPGVLGLFGFDFPWKGFESAIVAARTAGWRVLLISPNITVERAQQLQELHPEGLQVVPGWQPAESVVHQLSLCNATAFLYSTGNSGTSGAIRLGLAARRPLLLTQCRQTRDLYWLPEAAELSWVSGPGLEAAVAEELRKLEDEEYWGLRQARVAALAEMDSWDAAGEKLANHYRGMLEEQKARREAMEARDAR